MNARSTVVFLQEEERSQAGVGAIAALSLCTLLGSLAVSIGNVALPTLAAAFHSSFGEAQWIVLAYLLASTGLIIGAGRLGDIAGRRNVLIGGIGVFTAGSALCGLAPSLGVLIGARALQGAGGAAMVALSLAMAAECAPAGRTGKSMGLIASMSAIGTALGPSLGGILLQLAGWQAIFMTNVPVALAAAALARHHLPSDERRPATAVRFDWPGALFLGVALAALSLGATERDHPAMMAVALALAGLSMMLFIWAEQAASSPLVPPVIAGNRALAGGIGLSAAVSAAVMTAMVVGPFYLTQALSLPVAQVGMVMATGPILVALSAVPAGRLADGIGPEKMTLAGVAVAASGCLILAFQQPELGAGGFIAGFVVLTLGYSAFQTANNARVMSLAAPAMRGVISGMLSLSRNLGLIIGAAVMSALFAAAGGAGNSVDQAGAGPGHGMLAAFGLCSLIMGSAILVAWAGLAARGAPVGDEQPA